jgi:hypothetical protein
METSRCWVCHRSTTSCSSCRHFRRAVAGRLGYCAQDKRRTPLSGDEERACWESSPAETFETSNPVWGGAVSRAPAAGASLWGAPIAAEAAPDRPARGGGMWTESDSSADPEADRRQHGGSIRAQPWGRVPGLRDEAVWRKGVISKGRRP